LFCWIPMNGSEWSILLWFRNVSDWMERTRLLQIEGRNQKGLFECVSESHLVRNKNPWP
jgi:hypothetical protein